MALTPLTPHLQDPFEAAAAPNRPLINPRPRNPYIDWYHSELGGSWAQPAKQAYHDAVETLKRELSPDEFRSIGPSSYNSMLDVQSAVESALKDYETRAKASKAWVWLNNCSSRVKYYETVFDTLAQHYPEFTSLAWGTFKFLFTAVLNHEELLTEISKAISLIADLLPRTELYSELYRSERMREAVARLYAKIIDFALRAVQWSKKSKISHSVNAILRPLKLSFGPVIEEIRELSRRVDELANAAFKAEFRDLHSKTSRMESEMSRMGGEVSQLLERLAAQQSLQNEVLIDLRDQKQFFRNAQLEDVHQLMLQQGTPDSETSLAFCRSMRMRRVQKFATQLPAASIPTLKAWVDEPTSSLLLAESRGVRTSPLDFAVEFLNAVLEGGYPIIWALPFLAGSSTLDEERPQTLSIAGILRSLVLQTLQLSAAAMTETRNPVTIRHLRDATTIDQWFHLLERCVSTLADLFIVIDIGVLEAAINNAESGNDDGDDDPDDVRGGFLGDVEHYRVGDFIDRISHIIANRRHRQGRLKVVFTAVSFRQTATIDSYEEFGGLCIPTDRGRQIGRLMRQPKYRGMFRQRNKRISEELRTAVGKSESRMRQASGGALSDGLSRR